MGLKNKPKSPPSPQPAWVWLWGVILYAALDGETYRVTPPIPLRSVAAGQARQAEREEEARGRRVLWVEVVEWMP